MFLNPTTHNKYPWDQLQLVLFCYHHKSSWCDCKRVSQIFNCSYYLSSSHKVERCYLRNLDRVLESPGDLKGLLRQSFQPGGFHFSLEKDNAHWQYMEAPYYGEDQLESPQHSGQGKIGHSDLKCSTIFAREIFLLCPTHQIDSCELFQIVRQIVDIWFWPCYPLLQIRSLHLHKVFARFYLPPCTCTKPFAAIHLRQNSLAPARRTFYFLIDLQPGNRFAILHTYLDNCISRPDWIQRHDLAEMRASLTTPLQNRGRNLIRM